jgi:protein SCO1/2
VFHPGIHGRARRFPAKAKAFSWALVCATLGTLAVSAAPASAQNGPRYPDSYLRYAGDPVKREDSASMMPGPLKQATFRQQLNTQLPMDAAFKDETGKSVRLGDYFTGTRPTILAFVYYQCPMLCTQVMNGLSSALTALPFAPGKDFDIVLVSFDPRDTPATAAEKKKAHMAYWSAEATAGAWHFLTGDEASIKAATSAAGFSYSWDETTQQFAHVSGVLVVTPDGRLSRYFYGIEYSPKELRLALVDSGQGKIGSVVDELLLYCFHYNPESGRYGVMVMNLIRLGGVLTLACIAGFILLMRHRETGSPAEGRA